MQFTSNVLFFVIGTTATDMLTRRQYPITIAKKSRNTCRCLIPSPPEISNFIFLRKKKKKAENLFKYMK